MKKLLLLLFVVLCFSGCAQNFSDGFRVGYIQKFSKHGVFFKTYNGTLRVVSYAGQLASNTDDTWDFSLDRLEKAGENTQELAKKINEAMEKGIRVKLHYKQSTAFLNFISFRGDTEYFIQAVDFLK